MNKSFDAGAAALFSSFGNGTAGGNHGLLDELAAQNRVLHVDLPQKSFWLAAERLPMLQAVYAGQTFQPAPQVDVGSVPAQTWERENAIRELVRGRLEVSGPVLAEQLTDALQLSRTEIEAALLALEAEGFVLRGRFHPGVSEQEWCDRRLLARIHRLTIDRLQTEIQPVTPQEFYRFLFAWQRAGAGHQLEGPDDLDTILKLLDSCELPLTA